MKIVLFQSYKYLNIFLHNKENKHVNIVVIDYLMNSFPKFDDYLMTI